MGPGRALGYASRVPPLFRRKSTDLVADATSSVTPGQASDAAPRPKGYTPSKKELGVQTPKRTSSQRRRGTEPAPANRREAYKQMRARQREERAEATTGMRNGDEKFLLARDRGPERALVRAIVDSRRTVGTWFFARCHRRADRLLDQHADRRCRSPRTSSGRCWPSAWCSTAS